MATAGNGDKVKVNYTGKMQSGEVFDTTLERGPMEFTLGQAMVIVGVEKAVLGMAPGEKKTVNVSAEEGYGSVRPDMFMKFGRDELPREITPEPGKTIAMKNKNDEVLYTTVSEVTEEHVILDANHPLAGKELVFEIELMSIE